MIVSCNEAKQNGMEYDMIQRKRCGGRNVTNVSEKSRQEGLCAYQMGGQPFRHAGGEANRDGSQEGCLVLFGCRIGYVRLWPDSLLICLVMTIHVRKPGRQELDGHVRFITTGPCIPFFQSNFVPIQCASFDFFQCNYHLSMSLFY